MALTAQPLIGLPMYEIVIGGWRNTKSVIRHSGVEPPEVVEKSTPDIVNSDVYRGFWIHWKNNQISVGREGEDIPFMSYNDANLFPITYVAISTGNGATGTWRFEGKNVVYNVCWPNTNFTFLCRYIIIIIIKLHKLIASYVYIF